MGFYNTQQEIDNNEKQYVVGLPSGIPHAVSQLVGESLTVNTLITAPWVCKCMGGSVVVSWHSGKEFLLPMGDRKRWPVMLSFQLTLMVRSL